MNDDQANKKDNSQEYELFIRQREALINTANLAATGFAKAIMTLSGGALALSLKFMADMAHNTYPMKAGTLLASWIFLGLALAAITTSFLLAEFGQLKQVAINDEFFKKSEKTHPKNHYCCIISVLNITSLIAFLIGMFLTIAFAYNNLPPG